jgi:hypothetical protein
MRFMTRCWQFAIAPRTIRSHLNVQNGLIGTTASDAECLVFAVVDVVDHFIFLNQNSLQLSTKLFKRARVN